jgi:hypothetical protein
MLIQGSFAPPSCIGENAVRRRFAIAILILSRNEGRRHDKIVRENNPSAVLRGGGVSDAAIELRV